MRIDLLSEHPEYVEDLAAALHEQWRNVTPEHTIATRVARLRQHMTTDSLPIAWVAHEQGRPLGTAALRPEDLPGREDITPWLGGVVMPGARRRGIGTALCAVVEQIAQTMGFARLYLFTLDKEGWYTSLNWRSSEPISWRGLPGILMTKDLDR